MSKNQLTTEQLAQAALQTVKQMSPEQKAALRQRFTRENTKTIKTRVN